MVEKINVVFCAAREDEDLRLRLEQQLSALKHQDLIDLWHEQNVRPGADRREEIDRHLKTAHVVLLLISPDFMASDYCFSTELTRMMERHMRGEALMIPIILRPVHWQEAPFGNLQALPANAHPVTAWDDPDEALFNVVTGLRNTIRELIAHRQAHRLALFEYEMQSSKTSAFWVDPSAFSFDEAYESWVRTKRDFSSDEIIDQTWVKTSNPEHTFIVQFFFGGGLKEYALADPENQWHGSWKILDGKLRVTVSNYELDIFANQGSSVHSGIEFMQGAKEPHSHYACFPLVDTQAKHWDLNAVPGLVEHLFARILHQRVDPKLLITYGALLCRGEMSIRDIVKILGLSGKYKERFINLKRADKTIELLYATFLRQKSDPNKKLFHAKELLTRGSNVVIADLIDSEEYETLFR